MRLNHDHEIEKLEDLANLLDSRFSIPGTNIRFGLDGLLGLVPGIGDTVTAVLSFYIVARAQRFGVPRGLLLRMGGNVVFDWVVGSVPLLGDLFDLGFKANLRNVDLLKRHYNYPVHRVRTERIRSADDRRGRTKNGFRSGG